MMAQGPRVVVITGASEGIGRALALRMASEHAQLVLAARNGDRLAELAAACEEQGADTLTVPTDVTRQEDCRRMIDQTVDRFGRLDVLVNNAGITMWTPFEDVEDLNIYERIMAVNYLGSVYSTYFALPHLKESRGLIVALASVAGLTGVPTRTGYAASKHAMVGFFDSLRIELRGTGVDVSIVAPDFVVSQIHRRALKADGTPRGDTPMQEDKIMTAEACADHIVETIQRRKRLAILSARGRLGRWIKLVAPDVIDNIAKRAIESGK